MKEAWLSGCQPKADPPRAERHKLMYYVYILKSESTNKLYKGSTENLKDRLLCHNRGKVKSTKNYRP